MAKDKATPPLICAALDWDKTRKDYIECDRRNPVQLLRLHGIVTLRVALCDAHRALFEQEFAVFGGQFDKVKRVTVVGKEKWEREGDRR